MCLLLNFICQSFHHYQALIWAWHFGPFSQMVFYGFYFNLPNQDSQKICKRVVSTKHTMESFKGHFHVGVEQVRILSHILKGMEWEDLLDFVFRNFLFKMCTS